MRRPVQPVTATTSTTPSAEQLRAVLTEFEKRVGGFDPESTRYERGIRDALRAILNTPSEQDRVAALMRLRDEVEFD